MHHRNKRSTLGKASDITYSVKIKVEASETIPTLPTASTTVMLALSDAIVVALLEKKGFLWEDFIKVSSGRCYRKKIQNCGRANAQGKRSSSGDESVTMTEVMEEITKKNFGITGVTRKNLLIGNYRCGYRRYIVKHETSAGVFAKEIMSRIQRW